MAGHHDEHHSVENKPVSFTVPFILASVTIIITLLFLSLCDPKPHHEAHSGHEHEAHAGAVMQNHHEAEETKAAAVTTESKDTMTVESAAPEAEAHH
jgi:hypothetical protein